MSCISIYPFALKRVLVTLLALLGLSCISCFAEPFLLTVKATPYDSQMIRIRPILVSERHSDRGKVSLQIVNHWIEELRSIPYGFTKAWKTPAETGSGAPADCKAKAVALYDRMKEHGATDMRLIIGKRTSTSRSTHAWVEWETDGGKYVLDPTINWMACRSGDLRASSYVPYYAFVGARKYRAVQSTLVAQN